MNYDINMLSMYCNFLNQYENYYNHTEMGLCFYADKRFQSCGIYDTEFDPYDLWADFKKGEFGEKLQKIATDWDSYYRISSKTPERIQLAKIVANNLEQYLKENQ